MTHEIIILSPEEIIEINKRFNVGVKKGELEFIVSKIKSIKLSEDPKKDVAKQLQHYGIT